MYKRFVLFFMVAMWTNISHAEWTGAEETTDLRVYNGTVVLATLPAITDQQTINSCGSAVNLGQFSFLLGQPYSNALLAMLTGADLARRPVQVYLTGNCVEGRPEINGVRYPN